MREDEADGDCEGYSTLYIGWKIEVAATLMALVTIVSMKEVLRRSVSVRVAMMMTLAATVASC